MDGSALSGPHRGPPTDKFRPLYGEGRLFLLGVILGFALGVPAWLAAVAGHAALHQVPRQQVATVGVMATR